MRYLNRMVVDASASLTELCILGARYTTDKSPYNQGRFRHPYTAVYDLLFSPQKYENINIGEIGIAYNASIKMWRSYFTNAQIFGFEFNEHLIDLAKDERLPRTNFISMNVLDKGSIYSALNKAAVGFDILIEDSTHEFEDQMAVVEVALEFMNQGGVIVIEDIFRPWDEKRYEERLLPLLPFLSNATFIETNHENKLSDGTDEPYFDNDKLLVLTRNNRPLDRRYREWIDSPALLERALTSKIGSSETR